MILQPDTLILRGKYRVRRELGAGNFGRVYLAEHVDLRVRRAVKVLRQDDDGVGSVLYRDYRDRYRREFEVTAALSHANVLPVYDFEEEDGCLFAVLEYASGGSLADLLHRRPVLALDEALAILQDAAAGLDALHEREIIHRDVKPSNILLFDGGRAKIADLGLAQVPGDRDNSLRSFAPSAAMPHPGTPGYLSPEHRFGDPLQPTSDIYSLGCVAFEMLAGKPWQQVMRRVDNLRELRPEVPGWLDAVVMRMLRESPGLRKRDAEDEGKRFVTVGGVVGALRLKAEALPKDFDIDEVSVWPIPVQSVDNSADGIGELSDSLGIEHRRLLVAGLIIMSMFSGGLNLAQRLGFDGGGLYIYQIVVPLVPLPVLFLPQHFDAYRPRWKRARSAAVLAIASLLLTWIVGGRGMLPLATTLIFAGSSLVITIVTLVYHERAAIPFSAAMVTCNVLAAVNYTVGTVALALPGLTLALMLAVKIDMQQQSRKSTLTA